MPGELRGKGMQGGKLKIRVCVTIVVDECLQSIKIQVVDKNGCTRRILIRMCLIPFSCSGPHVVNM